MELPLENVFIVESKAHDSTTRIRVSFWKICPGMTGQSALGHWRLTFPPWAGGGGGGGDREPEKRARDLYPLDFLFLSLLIKKYVKT